MNTKFALLVFLTALLLAACGSQTVETSPQDSTAVISNQPTNSVTVPEDMDLQSVLAAGILMLEESDYPVSAEQAQELLILWKTVSSLQSADNVTTAEIDAIYIQIQESLTEEQLTAINDMDLTEFADLFGGGGPGALGDLSEDQIATLEAARESGDFNPPEGFGGGGGEGGFPDAGEFNPPEGFTFGEGFGGQGFGNPDSNNTDGQRGGAARGIVSQVIRFLEGRTAQ